MEKKQVSKHAIHLRTGNAFQVHHWGPCENRVFIPVAHPPPSPLPALPLLGAAGELLPPLAQLCPLLPLGPQLPETLPALWLSGNVLWFSASWLGGDHRVNHWSQMASPQLK